MQNPLKKKILLFRVQSLQNTEAFGEIYDLYIDRIFRYVVIRVKTREIAEDLAGEVFLRAWEFLIQHKQVSNLNAFLYKIAHNLVVDFYRKKEVKLVPDQMLLGANPGQGARDILQDLQLDADMIVVEKALQDLKDEYREAIILRFIEELGIGEIAEVLEKPKGTVRVILSRGLKALREIMEKQNVIAKPQSG